MPGCGFRKLPCILLLLEPPAHTDANGILINYPCSPPAVEDASPPLAVPWIRPSTGGFSTGTQQTALGSRFPAASKEGTGFILRWQLAAMNAAVKNSTSFVQDAAEQQLRGCGGDKALQGSGMDVWHDDTSPACFTGPGNVDGGSWSGIRFGKHTETSARAWRRGKGTHSPPCSCSFNPTRIKPSSPSNPL